MTNKNDVRTNFTVRTIEKVHVINFDDEDKVKLRPRNLKANNLMKLNSD
jgi:hypothetical protein